MRLQNESSGCWFPLWLLFPLVFNLGEYRRRATHMYKNHNFFRSDNEEAMALRERCAMDALDDVCDWLDNSGGEVAVSVAFFY